MSKKVKLVESKNNSPDFSIIFTPRRLSYATILKLVIDGNCPKQIADKMKISKQRLNYPLKMLKKSGLIEDGIRSSFKEYIVPDNIISEVKKIICEAENGGLKKRKIIKLNIHHISVKYPIVKNFQLKNGYQVARWRNKRIKKTIQYHGEFFELEQTDKNLIVKFPSDLKIQLETDFDAISQLKAGKQHIFEIAKSAIKNYNPKLLENLGKPKPSTHYAFKDEIARKITKKGITISYKRGKRSIWFDKSPHFSPRGEIETDNEEIALKYLESFID